MNGCVIVAGGRGTRMGGDVAKQFTAIEGIPIFIHTLHHIYDYDRDMYMVLVIPSHIDIKEVKNMILQHIEDQSLIDHIHIVHGGDSRSESVYNGLCALPDDVNKVGIHDAVRPFVTTDMLERLYQSEGEAVIPVVSAIDSLLLLDDKGGSDPLDRSKVVCVQTPQVFDQKIIKEAYNSCINRVRNQEITFTDDASLYTSYTGRHPLLVQGDINNIKITTPRDMATATYIINKQ